MENIKVETNMFDECETHYNCTVQVLRNSKTGEVSIGWWENDNPPTFCDIGDDGIE